MKVYKVKCSVGYYNYDNPCYISMDDELSGNVLATNALTAANKYIKNLEKKKSNVHYEEDGTETKVKPYPLYSKVELESVQMIAELDIR